MAPDEAARRRGRLLREAFGADALRIELQRPLWRGDRARLRAPASSSARELGCRPSPPTTCTCTTAGAGALQDALVAIRVAAAARGLRGGSAAATASTCSSRRPRWRRCSPTCPRPCGETADLAERCAFDLTSDLGYRYPSADDDGADRELRRAVHRRAR